MREVNVTVVGIGSMGYGIAHTLLNSTITKSVLGYDLNEKAVANFYNEAKALGKHSMLMTKQEEGEGDEEFTGYNSLNDVISKDHTDVVFLVLVNEKQCDQVCFDDSNNKSDSLISLLRPKTTVICCSTVTPTWSEKAHTLFTQKDIFFVDCPVSGGPARAKEGTLSVFASYSFSTSEFQSNVQPIMDVISGENAFFEIKGGAGKSSSVKMVHQLLAGVHICAAAEALAFAAKCGLDVNQMYDIVNSAAGSSWMFQDRGARMIKQGADAEGKREVAVKSALNIFVKDLGIVHSEAMKTQCPIPIANVALQQFISGQSLGLGRKDDSQVIQVYEKISGVECKSTSVTSSTDVSSSSSPKKETWTISGVEEEIVEVGDEPSHLLEFQNDYTRVLKVKFPNGQTTLAHKHTEDSIYFFLVEGGLSVINHVQGSNSSEDSCCGDCMEFGEVRFGSHKTDNKPLVHKITNVTPDGKDMFCIDAEILKPPPISLRNPLPFVHPNHTLIKTRDKFRVYSFQLKAGERSADIFYPFYYLNVCLRGSKIEKEMSVSSTKTLKWEETMTLGDISWNDPCSNLKIKNIGDAAYEAYIVEWR